MIKVLFTVFLVSCLVTLVCTYYIRIIALKYNIVDKPDNKLKPHEKATPYLGGLGIFLGVIVSVLVGLDLIRHESFSVYYLLVLMSAIMILGLLDDLIDITQNTKFFVQLIIALTVGLIGYQVQVLPLKIVSNILTAFYILGACNSINLLDGMDGLAAGNTLIAAVFFLILFILDGNLYGTVLSSALMGACFAFLFYNYRPAKMFMGDAGSMFIGFVLAMLMIEYTKKPLNVQTFMAPIFICSVPILDTGMTYLRRYLNNKPIFPGDRSHFYDQLVDRGISILGTIWISYALGILFGVMGLFIAHASTQNAIAIIAVFYGILLMVVLKLKMLKMAD